MCFLSVKMCHLQKCRMLLKACFLFSLLLIPLSAVTAQKVVNVYFCGTGVSEDWASSKESGFNSPELISFLYHNDLSEALNPEDKELSVSSHYYKLIIDGIATPALTPPALHHNFFNPDQWIEGENNRRWDECLDEAKAAIQNLLDKEDGTIDLNLLGHGRGGVLCMMLANHLANVQSERINKINILAFDPVAAYAEGDPLKKLMDDYNLSSLPAAVHQYIGIYAQDERSFRYEPLIPAFESPEMSSSWLISLPGSHETLVGNLMTDGHSVVNGQPNEETAINEELEKVNDLALVMAYQLLCSPEWGKVMMSKELVNKYDDIDESAFKQLVNAINQNIDFWPMHMQSFGEFFSAYDNDHYHDPAHVGHELLSSAETGTLHYRLCYHLPERETDNSSNPDRVFFMSKKVNALVDASMAWAKLQSLRGDISGPIPIYPELPDIVEQCEVDTILPPVAYDAVDGIITGTTEDTLRYTAQGSYTLTWHFTDASGNTTTQKQMVIVKDTIAPLPETDPLPLINGQCEVMDIPIPMAYDNCIGEMMATTDDPLHYPESGEYTILWVFDDGHGNITEQTQKIVVSDTIAPIITLKSTDPIEIWSPNHKYKTFKLDKLIETVSDNCTDLSIDDVIITSVSSDEAENGNGDGNTSNDIVIAYDCRSVNLRQERSGNGNGRVYTIFIAVADSSGNEAVEAIHVLVPHNQGKDAKTIDDGPAYTIESNCNDIGTYFNAAESNNANQILRQNYPNPFTNSTLIPLNIGEQDNLKLSIYDVNSRLIKVLHSGELEAGAHIMEWDGTDAANKKVGNGIYFCTLQSDETVLESCKLILNR